MKYEKIYIKLETYKTLEDNWDGYGGKKPSNATINNVFLFLELLRNNKIIEPKIMLSGNNEIGIYWKDKNVYYLEINFENNGLYSYFYEIGKQLFGKEDLTINFIDKELKDIFNNLNLIKI